MDSYHAKGTGVAGMDTGTFKSHTVRSASATATASAWITTNKIMQAANWGLESVFKRFCYKPANSNQVVQVVLSTSSTDSLRTITLIIQLVMIVGVPT